MKAGFVRVLVCAIGIVLAPSAMAALPEGSGNVPFWIGFSGPQQIDEQVARLLGDHAVAIALRYPQEGLGDAQSRALVARLHHAAPKTPVLMYAWASRSTAGRNGRVASMDWVNRQAGAMLLAGANGRPLRGFGNVFDPTYRGRTAASIAAAVAHDAFDGIVVDLAIRTPRYRPAPLARLCLRDDSFCARYAAGMDAQFAAIADQLGGKAFAYNGLWNFGPGSVADQQKLLESADAATVEYFGGNPNFPTRSFTHDVLPYLDAIAAAPEAKKIFVYGRGSWAYTDYAQDYATQRYQYCSFLLAARTNAFFKYIATFQLDSLHGRAGGLAVFRDWTLNLGKPGKPYVVSGGVYSRKFAHGLVLVAPDDGSGGVYSLDNTMYSPEGERFSGRIELQPGQGLLLLDAVPQPFDDNDLLNLSLLSDWPGATVSGVGATAEVALQADAPIGTHDMLLDPVRTLHPYSHLHMVALLGSAASGIDLVAEVDDPSHRQMYAVVALRGQGAPAPGGDAGASIGFRWPTRAQGAMPVVAGPTLLPGKWQSLDLDGRELFAKSGLVFRRWDFARFDGAMRIKSVGLVQ